MKWGIRRKEYFRKASATDHNGPAQQISTTSLMRCSTFDSNSVKIFRGVAQNRDEHSQAAESKAFFDFGTLLATSPDTSLRFAVELNRSGRAELDGRKIAGSDRTAALFEFGPASVVLPETLMDLQLGVKSWNRK